MANGALESKPASESCFQNGVRFFSVAVFVRSFTLKIVSDSFTMAKPVFVTLVGFKIAPVTEK